MCQTLTSLGCKVLNISFPNYGKTKSSALISDLLNFRFGPIEDLSVYFSSTLYSLDRYETLRESLDNLHSFDCVLFDRYTPSNIAYHCARVPQSQWPALSAWIEEFEYHRLALPRLELSFHLDVGMETSSALVREKALRAYTPLQLDAFEQNKPMLSRAREAYRYMIDNGIGSMRWHNVDLMPHATLRTPDSISQEIVDAIFEVR